MQTIKNPVKFFKTANLNNKVKNYSRNMDITSSSLNSSRLSCYSNYYSEVDDSSISNSADNSTKICVEIEKDLKLIRTFIVPAELPPIIASKRKFEHQQLSSSDDDFYASESKKCRLDRLKVIPAVSDVFSIAATEEFLDDLERKKVTIYRRHSQISVVKDILNVSHDTESISNVSLDTLNNEQYFDELEQNLCREFCQIQVLFNWLKDSARQSSHEDNTAVNNSVLMTEIKLLVSGAKYKQLDKYITELINDSKVDNVGTLTLNNFHFTLKNADLKNRKSKFFVLVITCGLDVIASKPQQAVDDYVQFNDTFVFKNCPLSFQVKAKIFSITLKNVSRFQQFLNKRTKPLKELLKQFLSTNTSEDAAVALMLKSSSFKLRGALTLTVDDLPGRGTWSLTKSPGSPLATSCEFALKANDLRLDTHIEGYLSICSREAKAARLKRYWCVLRGARLTVYEKPGDQSTDNHWIVFDLRYSFYARMIGGNMFALKTVRPAAADDNDLPVLASKPNFVIVYYYFKGCDVKCLRGWRDKINYVVKCLNDWHVSFLEHSDWELKQR